MATLRQGRANYLGNNGFLPAEARELSRTSRGGLRSPYFQRWIRSRRGLYQAAIRLGWTEKQYRDRIRKQYEDGGFVKRDSLGRYRADVWAMLRYQEELSRRKGEEYESPWRKKTQRKSGQRREVKRVTKRKALESWIKQLNRNIERTNSESRKAQLRAQRERLADQLRRLG